MLFKNLFSVMAICLFFLPMSITKAVAHHGNFQICNISQNEYGIAFASRIGIGILGKDWKFSGFYAIDAGECIDPFGSNISDAIQSYIAVRKKTSGGYVQFNNEFSSNNKFASPSNEKFCVKLDQGFSFKLSLEFAHLCTGESHHPFHILINVPSIPIGQGATNILFLK